MSPVLRSELLSKVSYFQTRHGLIIPADLIGACGDWGRSLRGGSWKRIAHIGFHSRGQHRDASEVAVTEAGGVPQKGCYRPSFRSCLSFSSIRRRRSTGFSWRYCSSNRSFTSLVTSTEARARW